MIRIVTGVTYDSQTAKVRYDEKPLLICVKSENMITGIPRYKLLMRGHKNKTAEAKTTLIEVT